MIIAATGSLQAAPNAPIVYRGDYETIFPMMKRRRLSWNRTAYSGFTGYRQKKTVPSSETESTGPYFHRNGRAYGKWHWNIADRDEKIRNLAVECLKEHMITASPYRGVVILGSTQGRFRDAGSREEFVYHVGKLISAGSAGRRI